MLLSVNVATSAEEAAISQLGFVGIVIEKGGGSCWRTVVTIVVTITL